MIKISTKHVRCILKVMLLVALSSSVAVAQIIERRQAERLVDAGEYQRALEIYRNIYQKRQDLESTLDLADIYLKLHSYEEAETYYRSAASYQSCPARAFCSFGDVLMFSGNYKEARIAYYAFATRGGDPIEARERICSCDSAFEISKRPPFFTVSNERRINTKYSEFAAAMCGSYIVFTSDRPIGYQPTDKEELKATISTAREAGSKSEAVQLLLRNAQDPTSVAEFNRISWTDNPKIVHSKYDGDKYDLFSSEHDKTRRREQLARERRQQEKLRDKKRKIYGETGRPYLNMYLSNRQDKPNQGNGLIGSYVWTAPVMLPAPLNTGEHSGPCCFTPDGNTMYFCFSELLDEASQSSVSHVGIMISHKDAGGWSNPALFPYNNRAIYSVGHPCISADGRTIYFSSDMPGTLGGRDIFKCVLTANGEWGAPQNLGPVINTEDDEVFPTLDNNGTLYFSSDGHPGLGGLDLFRAVGKPDEWTSVENLRAPVNTSADDFSLVFLPGSNNEGLFSSNRTGGYGGDDIYSFKRVPPPVKIIPEPQEKFMIAITVVNRADSSPLAGVRLILQNAKTRKNMLLTTDGAGKVYFPVAPKMAYSLTSEVAGFLPSWIENISTNKIKPGKSIRILLPLDPLMSGSTFSVENVYYDFGKADLKQEAFKELDKVVKFMKMNPDVRIELSSHTDSRGSLQGNMSLSQKRAESCVAYLVKKGISRSRIAPKGYGPTKPRIKNAKTEKQHAKNRRTEIKVLETGKK